MAPTFTNPPRTLEGKVAIVTGASRGIGEAIAFDLASRGAVVALTFSSDRSRTSAEALITQIEKEVKSKAVAIQCDLRSLDAPAQIVRETVAAFGDEIDIVVHNAGFLTDKTLKNVAVEDYSAVFDLNVRAPLFLTQAVLPHLRAPARIINISSVGSRLGIDGTGVYSASKAALEGFTRAWAAELGASGTTVNAVNPGPVMSEMLAKVDKEYIDGQRNLTPVQKRLGTPEEIASVVAFLAEERSSWVSGQCISASGGFAMY